MKGRDLFEEMMALENYWPRADVAIYDVMKCYAAKFKVIFNRDAWVVTSGRRISATIKQIVKEHKHPSLAMDATYANEAPASSRPYYSTTTATVKH